MDYVFKNSLNGFIGHTICPFMLYSYDKRKDSYDHNRNKVYTNENIDKILQNSQENVDLNGNNDKKNYIESSDESDSLVECEYYNGSVKLQNMVSKNNVGYNRFINSVNIDESRSVIYGTWEPESSEMMWNQITGGESDTNLMMNDSQIITEEDLIKSNNPIEVLFLCNHLREFVEYDVESDVQNNEQKIFKYNNKYVIMFGGAYFIDNNLLECYSKLKSLIYGNLKFEVTNNVYYYEAKSFRSEWKVLNVMKSPQPRAFHASCVVYTSLESPILLICGGFEQNKKLIENELYVLNLGANPLIWKVFETSGKLPPKRYGHSLSQVGSYLVLFGGTDGVNLLNDIWALNINYGIYEKPGKLSSNCWNKLELWGVGPSPRAFHSTCKLGISSNSPMVVYGGFTYEESTRNRLYSLQLVNDDKLIWAVLPVYVRCPSESRAFHSMVFACDKLVITGGEDYRNDGSRTMRSLSYSLDNKTFQYIEDNISLSGHQSWAAFGMIYHWGGVIKESGKILFDDSITISNPLSFNDEESVEQLYLKYIEFASMGSIYDSKNEDSENKEKEDSDNLLKLDSYLEVELKSSDLLSIDSKLNEQGVEQTIDENKSEKYDDSKNKQRTVQSEVLNKKEDDDNKECYVPPHPVETKPYQQRPRRSAAAKCLTAIELDNKRHKEIEMKEINKEEQ